MVKPMWCCVVTLLLLLNPSHAVHFRFGSISWDHRPGGSGGRLVRFTINTAWAGRARFGAAFRVGDTLSEQSGFFPNINAATRFASVFTVSSFNEAQDWITGVQVVDFEYAADGNYIARFEGFARITSLLNNPFQTYIVRTRVPIVSARVYSGIRSAALPIITLVRGARSSFVIPAIAQQREVLRYRLSSGVEVAGPQASTYRQVPGLSIDYVTGEVSLQPSVNGLSNVQVTIEGHAQGSNPQNGNDNSLVTSTAVDFLIQVIDPGVQRCKRFCSNPGSPCSKPHHCTNCFENGILSTRTPFCDFNNPPAFLRALSNGAVLTRPSSAGNFLVEVDSDVPLTLLVDYSDSDDEDLVTITSSNLPQNATSIRTIGNPGSINITYIPRFSLGGNVICFTAVDSLFNPSTGQVCIEVRVLPGNFFVLDPPASIAAGQARNITVDDASTPAERSHTVSIFGGPQSVSFNTLRIVNASTRGNGFAHYVARINQGPGSPQLTMAGSYVMSVADTTVGLTTRASPVSYPFRVVPAESFNCDVFDEGTGGIDGGVESTQLFFMIRSRDVFNNTVTDDRRNVDGYVAIVRYNGIETSYPAIYSAPGRWNASYFVPNRVIGIPNSDKFQLIVRYTRNSQIIRDCSAFTASIVTAPFQARIESQTVYTAGNNITFAVVRTSGSQGFTATVNGVPAAILSESQINPQTRVFNFTLIGGLRTARTYLNEEGIAVQAAGFFDTRSFTVTPDAPSALGSVLGGDLTESLAGEESWVTIELRDAFENRISRDAVRISYQMTHSDPNERSQMGIASYDSQSNLYKIPYMFTRVGTVAFTPVFNETNTPIGSSPYSIQIFPGGFAVATSSVSSPQELIAGDQENLVISANDKFFNPRDPAIDSFSVTFSSASATGNSSVLPDLTSNRYFIPFSTQVTGYYQILIKANVFSQGGIVPFRALTIRVLADEIVPEFTSISGDGVSGGVTGQQSQLLIQARDRFLNAVDDLRNKVPFVVVQPGNGVDSSRDITFWPAIWRPGTQSICFSGVNFFSLEAGIDDVTPEEAAISSTGYFETYYQTPRPGQFTIKIYLTDASLVGPSADFSEILQRNETVLAVTTSAVSREAAAFVQVQDQTGLIVGLTFAVLVLLVVSIYGGWRLRRYRSKYKTEKARADVAEKDLQEIAAEIDIIPGGRDFNAVGGGIITTNPLHEVNDAHRNTLAHEMEHDAHAPARQEFRPVKPRGSG